MFYRHNDSDKERGKYMKLFICMLLCGIMLSCDSDVVVKNKPANIKVNPTSIDFGEIEIGESKTISLTILNVGDLELTIDQITQTPKDTILSISIAKKTIATQGESIALIKFSPTEKKSYQYSLLIVNNSQNSPALSVTITGKGKEKKTDVTDTPTVTTTTVVKYIDDDDDQPDTSQDCPSSTTQCDNTEPTITLLKPENNETISEFIPVHGDNPYLRGVTLTAEVNYHSCKDNRQAVFYVRDDAIGEATEICVFSSLPEDKNIITCDFTGIPKDSGIYMFADFEWYVSASNECFTKESEVRVFKAPDSCEILKTDYCTPDVPVETDTAPANNETNIQPIMFAIEEGNPQTVPGIYLRLYVDFKTCHGEFYREFWVKEKGSFHSEKLCYNDDNPNENFVQCSFTGIPYNSGIKPNTEYEWYVSIDNECAGLLTSSYSFTTGSF